MRSSASVAALTLALAACAHARAERYDETGAASWYGEELAGRPTASGARFDPQAVTVAHRTLPLGSVVALTAVDTGRTIVALVTDRGPFHDDRLVDLSLGAARQLGTTTRPVSRIRVRAIVPTAEEAAALHAGREAPPREPGTGAPAAAPIPISASGRYLIRVGTFSSRPRAAALAQALGAQLVPAGALYRVILGPYDSNAAQRARDAVARRGYGDAATLPQP